ncbi:MerR family transcriptional regulator [Microbacterium dauci]|uniref:MerR family transcriptional regulator n=1 Tax=Microbacterium dauci TaxID=3048008 RepID=A0ABT6ZFG7_9MICO|nr:MerR family transcriptional regulator [Microbacterium sp. LX3-4]MDJ1114907.1 MerR family transcriptional regulator [Microbacterium sp. LX3-4]
MTHDQDDMTAGRFAAATLLTPKALRVYAERGLLRPSRVDVENGYRYYSPSQVATGWLIGLLRSADLSLDDVEAIVAAASVDEQGAIDALDAVIEASNRRNDACRAVLARARLHLRKEATVTTVHAGFETDRPVLSVMRRVAPHELDHVICDAVSALRGVAAEAGVAEAGDPFGIFHAPVTDDSDGPLEIVLPVEGLIDAGADVRSYRLSGGAVALRSAEGTETDFPAVLALYDEVHSWITDAGRTPVGPPREIWHTSPKADGGLRLTVAWPFAERGDARTGETVRTAGV